MQTIEGPQRDQLGRIYLAAMAVVAKRHRRRVLSIEYASEHWPGVIEFERPTVSEFECEFARYGHETQRRQVERGVIILLAGATAIALLRPIGPLLGQDRYVREAQRVLRHVCQWDSEADAYVAWLQHRTARHLTADSEWSAVMGVAQMLQERRRVPERQIRQAIVAAKRRQPDEADAIGVQIKASSKLCDIGEETAPPATKCDPALASFRMTDGIVTPELLDCVAHALQDQDARNAAIRRMRQVEPHLLGFIERPQVYGRPWVSANDNASLDNAAFMQSLVVAETIRSAVKDLWR